MKILITGAFGYLGGRISSFFSSISEYEIILASTRAVKTPSSLKNIKVIQINWKDEESISNACTNIDVIIHAAGMNAQDCKINPEEALNVNGIYTARLVKNAILHKVKKIIYFSTAHVYSSPLKGIITEDVSPKNKHPYSTSNLAGENYVIQAHLSSKLQGVVLRLSNCIGAPKDINSNCWMLLVNDLCRQIIVHRKMKLNTNGKQLRNFITITDVCRVLNLFIELNFKSDENTIFNVGNKTISIIEMANIIQKRCKLILGFSPKLEIKKKDNVEVENFQYRTDKLDSIGFKSQISYEKEIDDLLIFCKNHF
jgi:UDP-glucose 4-epimerase